jgi:hypothetical protein
MPVKENRYNCHNCTDICRQARKCELRLPIGVQMIEAHKVDGFIAMMNRLNLKVQEVPSGFFIVGR